MPDADLCTINGVVYISMEEGLKRVMGNKKLYIRLLTKFKDDTKLDGLMEALKSNDMEAARVEAHTLKGISANLSLNELFIKTQDLESQVKAGAADPGQVDIVKKVFNDTLDIINKVIEQNGNG